MTEQNPAIPALTNPVDIDGVILDVQVALDVTLPWLTDAYGRAYQLIDATKPKERLTLPYIYIGKDRGTPKYFDATPDNDKQGQCLFFVSRETAGNATFGGYGWLNYNLSIIFSVNLELVNSTLLDTELFTSNLVADVRNVLIRENVGTPYQLEYVTTIYNAAEVWQGMNIELSTVEKAPLQHFRMDFNVLLKEDCAGLPYDPCTVLLDKLSQDQKNNCILPSYDFSNPIVQQSLSSIQEDDLRFLLCGVAPILEKSILIDNSADAQYIATDVTPAYDFEYNTPFTLSCWVKVGVVNVFANLFNHWSSQMTNRGYFTGISSDYRLRIDLQSTNSKRLSISTPANAIIAGTWNHVVFTYSGSPGVSSLSIYINGALQQKQLTSDTLGNDTIKQPNLRVWFGINMGFVSGFNGRVSDFRIWSTALSQSDVNIEYTGLGRNNPVSSLSNIGWCKCGNEAVFGADTWIFQDNSQTTSGYKSIAIPANATSLDVPV